MGQVYNYDDELSNKIALVTAGTKGLWKAITERLSNAGVTVINNILRKPNTKTVQNRF